MRELLLAGVIVAGGALPAHATITFDGVGLTTQEQVPTTPLAVGSGFTLRSTALGAGVGSLIIDAVGNQAESGGNSTLRYLSAHDTQSDTSTVLARADALSFTLASFDFHGWNNNYAQSITVTGALALGGTIAETFQLTNTFSQPFQTATLLPTFTGLTSVTFHGDLRNFGNYSAAVYALDNIEAFTGAAPVPTTVPEPTSLVLLSLGVAGIAAARRTRLV